MFAEIRKYNSNSVDEVIRRANEGFVPLISKHAGFKAYYILKEGENTFATLSFFETQAEARDSNKLAADWVHKNLAELLPQPPEITEGDVKVAKQK